jgi:hypothetical protein
MDGLWQFLSFIFSLPLLVHIATWAFGAVLNPSPEKIGQAGQLIAQAAIPWWISVIQFLASLGLIGVIGIIIILIFVARNGV